MTDAFRDRYRAIRTGFWWRVRIGDGQQTVGRCYTQTEALRLAAALQDAFEDGRFVGREERAEYEAAESERMEAARDDDYRGYYP